MISSLFQLKGLAAQIAMQTGYPEWLLFRQIDIESNWRLDAVSSCGALGLCQVMPATAADPGYGIEAFDPTVPELALHFLCNYMVAMHKRTSGWGSALCAYNVGLHASPGSASPAYRHLAAYADQVYGVTQA